MTEVRKNITLDAISQLASIFMNHNRNEKEVVINANCKEEDYDLKITIEKIPK